MAHTSQTVLAFGIMVGAILFTTLSDKYGRRPVFLFSQVMLAAIGVITAFVENIYLFFFLRFLAGALQQVNIKIYVPERTVMHSFEVIEHFILISVDILPNITTNCSG